MTDVILDQATLDQLRLLPGRTHPQLLTEVSAVFFEETMERLGTLREAAAHGDMTTLIRIAHTVRGSSAALGARAMVQLCKALEYNATTLDSAALAHILDDLEQAFAAVRRILSAEQEAEGGHANTDR